MHLNPLNPLDSLNPDSPASDPASSGGSPSWPDAQATEGARAVGASAGQARAHASGRAACRPGGASSHARVSIDLYSGGFSARAASHGRASCAMDPAQAVHAQFVKNADGTSSYAVIESVVAPLDLPDSRAYLVGDRWMVCPKPNRISEIECLLRAAICDGKRQDEAMRILAEPPVACWRGMSDYLVYRFLLGDDAGRSVKRYGECRMLVEIENREGLDEGKFSRNALAAEQAVGTMHQALASMFDYVLFIRREGRDMSLKLVHAVDMDSGVISFRELPSGAFGTARPFPSPMPGVQDRSHWALLGFKKNGD
ncbi:hypothetical protein [Achromobacter aloeverae]